MIQDLESHGVLEIRIDGAGQEQSCVHEGVGMLRQDAVQVN